MSSEDHHDVSRFQVGTRLIHGRRAPKEQFGFINTPIYRGSSIIHPDLETFETADLPYIYGRKGTPTMAAFEGLMAELDGAAGAISTPSGLCAVTTAILSCVSTGDHILVNDNVYRCTREFCDTILKRMGVETKYYDPTIGAEIQSLMRPETRLVYTETPGSHTMEMQDIPAIADIAHKNGSIVLTDNSWGTPLFFDALGKGADLCIHAATKYIAGHSDTLIGAVSANERLWGQLKSTREALGICASPDDLFLALRGFRTMRVRMDYLSRAGLEMAQWFSGRPEISQVLYPALPASPGYHLWKRDFTGASSLFSVILQPTFTAQAIKEMLNGLELFSLGLSWGGFASLVTPFNPVNHRTVVKWCTLGQALRFYIGLEDLSDLKNDLEKGFERLHAAPT
ncbi:MAG: cystathionine beta-lyase [Alphaproteobacteria bacterium]|nr:cystathionine beta-lyase [Alphaproteobacteria bacterium]